MWKAVIVLVAGMIILAGCTSDHSDGHDESESYQLELHAIDLAVASVMSDPIHPIRTLDGSDTRITDAVRCGTDMYNPLAITQDMTNGGLLTVCATAECVAGRGTPSAVSDFLAHDTARFWYCVHDDGRVWGYREECVADPKTDCEDVCYDHTYNPFGDDEGTNYWAWIGIPALIIVFIIISNRLYKKTLH